MDLVTFDYRNHKGEVATRRVRPIRLWYGCTAWHNEAGWLLEAFDLDRLATRDFSMAGMLGPWRRLDGAGAAQQVNPIDPSVGSGGVMIGGGVAVPPGISDTYPG